MQGALNTRYMSKRNTGFNIKTARYKNSCQYWSLFSFSFSLFFPNGFVYTNLLTSYKLMRTHLFRRVTWHGKHCQVTVCLVTRRGIQMLQTFCAQWESPQTFDRNNIMFTTHSGTITSRQVSPRIPEHYRNVPRLDWQFLRSNTTIFTWDKTVDSS